MHLQYVLCTPPSVAPLTLYLSAGLFCSLGWEFPEGRAQTPGLSLAPYTVPSGPHLSQWELNE
jgi:hypothetical protein